MADVNNMHQNKIVPVPAGQQAASAAELLQALKRRAIEDWDDLKAAEKRLYGVKRKVAAMVMLAIAPGTMINELLNNTVE
jgi:hypothetical protein